MIKTGQLFFQLSGFLVFYIKLYPLNYTKLFFCIIVYIGSTECEFECSIKLRIADHTIFLYPYPMYIHHNDFRRIEQAWLPIAQ